MGQFVDVHENGIHMVFYLGDEKDVHFLHFGAKEYPESRVWDDGKKSPYRMVEVQLSGENVDSYCGSKHLGGLSEKRLKCIGMTDTVNQTGRKLEFVLFDANTGAEVTVHYQFYTGIPVIRCWSAVVNKGAAPLGLEYLTSFAYAGIDKGGKADRAEKIRVGIPHHTWSGEAQWKFSSLHQLGLYRVQEFSMKRISRTATGTWSSSEYAPAGFLQNTQTETSYYWQIEHNGSWHWEISDVDHLLYLHLSGPTEAESHWWKNLLPGDTFTSVPVAVCAVEGGFEEAVHAMTAYRRAMRRPNEDNRRLPVIFNDYMNCLRGDPTTEKLLPLVDAAAKAGCEYFCIDSGWYSDGYWWDGVGEWLPSDARFPGGIAEPLAYIREKGMVPGLWLELEVMGINCPLAGQLPDDWFFVRHGKRVKSNRRYQLDYRNPAVRQFATDVIARLVDDYGVGYIKMDYNINAGIGTELQADSFGDGLLCHQRAYLAWLDEIFARYPDLVIENCGSGGMREDYAMLARHSIQSSSDQGDYKKNAVIAAASPSLVAPEQCAVWSYPLEDGDEEETIFNMVSALLCRVHQSGHLAKLNDARFALVKEAIDYYKTYRHQIPSAQILWPLGVPDFDSTRFASGLRLDDRVLLAVWRLNAEEKTMDIPLRQFQNMPVDVQLAYPRKAAGRAEWDQKTGVLRVEMDKTDSARIFELRPAGAGTAE